MRQYFATAALFALCSCAAATAGAAALENIPLKWTPTSTFTEMGTLNLSGPLITMKTHIDTLVDTRQNPPLVGENREHPDKVRTVTTSSDVATFVTDHLKDTLHGAGLNLVDSGADITISGEIRQFFVTEVNTYDGEVSLLLHVRNGAGKELWTGVVSGDATRWGRSYKADNYYEAMSNMLLRAAYNLLDNADLRAALAKP